jgi:hypothetical protein
MLEFLWAGSNKPPLRGGPDVPPEGTVSRDGVPSEPASSDDVGEGTPPSAAASEEPPLAEAVDPSALPSAFELAGCSRRHRGRRLVKPAEPNAPLTPEQRLLGGGNSAKGLSGQSDSNFGKGDTFP